MMTTFWKPTLLATLLVLGLAGCGNGDESAGGGDASQSAEQVPEEQAAEEQAPAVAESDDSSADGQAAEEAPPAEEGESETMSADAEVSADVDSLGESPEDALEEEGALPGEATREDVDAIIEETERRFEEAQQRIDEQFEQAEQETSVPEPMEGDDFESSIDIDSSLGEDPLAGEGAGESDIDAIIEEQERRFEEAQRELEQQFEEIEREVPELEGFDTEPMSSETPAPASAEEAAEE
ncbi:hypothetical protein [Halomonas sp. H10-9-1]|uniref:hypothetical protein n=1 Tax=Halomonas sp. H10-9-1 TaxID=2950871 RepID=UPI0032DF5031